MSSSTRFLRNKTHLPLPYFKTYTSNVTELSSHVSIRKSDKRDNSNLETINYPHQAAICQLHLHMHEYTLNFPDSFRIHEHAGESQTLLNVTSV